MLNLLRKRISNYFRVDPAIFRPSMRIKYPSCRAENRRRSPQHNENLQKPLASWIYSLSDDRIKKNEKKMSDFIS